VGAAVICSDELPPRGATTIGSCDVRWFHAPHGEAERGGDRFIIIDSDGELWFLLADAAGHGRSAEVLWDNHGDVIHAALREAADSCSKTRTLEERIRGFGAQINEHLAGTSWTGEHPSHLCASVGAFTRDRTATWANLGYGTHVLALTPDGLVWNEPERLFGLKLGWLDPDDWSRAPRAVVANEARLVERLVLLTDGFLPGDHHDVDGTLAKLQLLGESCSGLAQDQVVQHVLNECSCGHDDATLLVIERSGDA
jgi:hypothetical protein